MNFRLQCIAYAIVSFIASSVSPEPVGKGLWLTSAVLACFAYADQRSYETEKLQEK